MAETKLVVEHCEQLWSLLIEAAQIERVAAGLYWNPVLSYNMGNIVLGSGNPQGTGLSPGAFSELVHTIGISEVVDVWSKRGARIRIGGLGILQVRKRPARMGRNPATGEAIKIKASKKIAFRAAKDLKESI